MLRRPFELNYSYKIPSEDKSGAIKISGPEPEFSATEIELPYTRDEFVKKAQEWIGSRRSTHGLPGAFARMYI